MKMIIRETGLRRASPLPGVLGARSPYASILIYRLAFRHRRGPISEGVFYIRHRLLFGLNHR